MKHLFLFGLLFIASCASKEQIKISDVQTYQGAHIIYNEDSNYVTITDTNNVEVVHFHKGIMSFKSDTAAIKTLLMILAQQSQDINNLYDTLSLYKWYKCANPTFSNYKE